MPPNKICFLNIFPLSWFLVAIYPKPLAWSKYDRVGTTQYENWNWIYFFSSCGFLNNWVGKS